MDAPMPKNSFEREDLLACARGDMFGPGNAQLPAPPMLMFDRVTQVTSDGGAFGKGQIVAELDIKPDLWFFGCHFIGDPVMPGCLGLDALWQIIGYWLGWSNSPGKGRALGVGEVKFRGYVTPDKTLVRYEVDLKRVRRGKLAIAVADGRLFVDGECVYTANDLSVGMILGA